MATQIEQGVTAQATSGTTNAEPDAVLKPSEAYKSALDSPVYRLSELMFGSLLAAYVLGFISYTSAFAGGRSPLSWEYLSQMMAPLCTSICYAYLTAGLYAAYHAAIMTMHHMPLKRLSFDFALALSQGLAFGFAIIDPTIFPATVGTTILLSVWRMNAEHKKHVRKFYIRSEEYKRIVGVENRDDENVEVPRTFSKKFDNLLGDDKYDALHSWKSAGWNSIAHGVGLVCISLILYFLADARSGVAPIEMRARFRDFSIGTGCVPLLVEIRVNA